MQNRVMRVRSSLGLKFRSEFSEKGSARIETDSSTIARVEVAETLNNNGLLWVAPDVLAAPHMNAARPAHTVARKRLREAKARIFIRIFSLVKQFQRSRLTKSLVEGRRATEPWFD